MPDPHVGRPSPARYGLILLLGMLLANSAPGQSRAQTSASVLLAQGDSLAGSGEYGEALPIFSAALAEISSMARPDSILLGKTLMSQGAALRESRRFDDARPVLERGLTVAAAVNDTLMLAEAHNHRGSLYWAQAYYERQNAWAGGQPIAQESFRKCLALRDAVLEPHDRLISKTLMQLARVSSLEEAVDLYGRAIEISEMPENADDPDAWRYYNGFGISKGSLGHFLEAIDAFERAVDQSEAIHGEQSPESSEPLSNLSLAFSYLGEPGKAYSASERALNIRRALFGENSMEVAISLGNHGGLVSETGDFEAAHPLVARSLVLLDSLRGPSPYKVAYLNSLGSIEMGLGNLEEARTRYLEAAAIDSTSAHFNLGMLSYRMGEYDEATEYLKKSLALFENLYPMSSAIPEIHLSIGEVAMAKGDLPEAERSFEAGLRKFSAVFGGSHQVAVNAKANLAALYAMQGNDALAESSARRAAEAADELMTETLPNYALAEQRVFGELELPKQFANVLTLTRNSIDRTYGLFMGWKGLLTHSLRRQKSVAELGSDPQWETEVTDLRQTRLSLGSLYGEGIGAVPTEVWTSEVDSLTSRKEELERLLSRALPANALVDPLADGLDGLRRDLGATEAFVDVYRYRHAVEREFRYAAIVVGPDFGPDFVDLGLAQHVDDLVTAWYTSLQNPVESQRLLGTLREALWAPIAKSLRLGVDHAWLSPDGMLARLSWRSLLDADEPELSIIDDARSLALLIKDRERPMATRVLLVGALDYTGTTLDQLAGTAEELNFIEEIGQSTGRTVTTLRDSNATRERVSDAMQEVAVIHLATHGFFYGSQPTEYLSRGTEPVGSSELGASARNPLAQSGLYLSARDSVAGTLTAEDLVGLQLSADLVVLSACETGRGEEITSQGVQGLRSAISASGARSILMSLWKVPDDATALLMSEFYRGIWGKGLSKSGALTRAQDLVKKRFPEPVNWAAWVLVGDVW